jgi:hypothetical protein
VSFASSLEEVIKLIPEKDGERFIQREIIAQVEGEQPYATYWGGHNG